MSDSSMQRVLFVSSRSIWSEALEIALEETGVATASASRPNFLVRFQTFKPTSVVIDADSKSAASAPDEVARMTRVLRSKRPQMPIVLVTSLPRNELNALAADVGGCRVLLPQRVQPAALAHEVLSAIAACPPDEPVIKESLAAVEIKVGQATMECSIRIGGKTWSEGPKDWTQRKELEALDEEFSLRESGADPSWRIDTTLLRFAGRRLSNAFEDSLSSAYAYCRPRLLDKASIHHRFELEDGDLEFVPFEILCTRNRDEYLRYVYPLARRLVPRQEHASPDRPPIDGKPRLRVLFILSDATGVLSVPSHKFKGKDAYPLGALRHLRAELDDVRALYGDGQFKELVLSPSDDNLRKIRDAFDENAFDIVHFAGHSVRADGTGKVFLALPAPPGSRLVPYNAESFASLASEGDTRLVILSSCEAASGLALSRMASSGVPAVAGFRWPVDDQDASVFTIELHRELQRGPGKVPLSLAFHRALLTLRDKTEGRVSGFSPVLMIQRSGWHDFNLEV